MRVKGKMKTIKIFLALLMLLFSLCFVSAYSPFFTDFNNFDDGVYSNTFLNGSYVELSGDNLTGEYYSEIFESDILGIYTQWYNISWVGIPFLYGEFPDNQAVEDDANMTGNVFLLHFNETSGTIYDRSGNGFTGVESGGLTYNVTGYFNNAFSFDGINDFINFSGIQYNISLNDSLAISLWVKTEETNAGFFISKQNVTVGFSSGIAGSGNNNTFNLAFNTNDSTNMNVFAETNISDNEWHNIVINYGGCRNSSCVNFYLDGEVENQGLVFSDNLSQDGEIFNDFDLLIGSKRGIANFFNGTIDELAVWNRTLTEQEISDYYLRGFPDINISVRSCEVYDCSDKNFTLINSTPENLDFIDRGHYFQYRADFSTQNVSVSSKLFNVTVYYIRNTSIADEELTPIYWDINDSLPTNATTHTFGATELENLFDDNVGTPWIAQNGILPRAYFGSYYNGCAFCSGDKLCEDAWFIINLTDTYDITRFRTYNFNGPNMAYIWSADRYFNGSWNNINNYSDAPHGWIEKEWYIEDVDAIRINLEGATSICGGGGENMLGWYEIEVYGYPSFNDSITNCEDYTNCVFLERFNDCENDILETGGWFGQSEACINNSLICNSSDLTQQFYRYFDTVDSSLGDLVFSFSLNIQDKSIPLKIDVGHNDEFAIRLKFDDGIIYDNYLNEPLLAYEENVEYDYKLFFNLASQNYFLYRDNVRMDLTEQNKISFYNAVQYVNFIQFVPDLYSPSKNCEWALDDLSLFGEQALNVSAGVVSRQMVGGIDFANRTAGFDESVCLAGENRHLCFARSVGTDILNSLKNWILGGLILFVVLLIILFAVLMFKHNR